MLLCLPNINEYPYIMTSPVREGSCLQDVTKDSYRTLGVNRTIACSSKIESQNSMDAKPLCMSAAQNMSSCLRENQLSQNETHSETIYFYRTTNIKKQTKAIKNKETYSFNTCNRQLI